jgi:glycosyltransferase involved in cell wall biosynthesis
MRVLVAHPAQQHSYRIATALKNAGMLDKYITTVYYKKRSLTYLVSKVLKGALKTKAENRRCESITDAEVIQFCEVEGLLKLVAINTRFFKKRYNRIKYHTADRFAKRVAKYAIKHRVDAVVTYDDCSPLLFEELKKKAPDIIRVLDMSAANILYMKNIYERDMELVPAFADRLHKERSICWDPVVTKRAEREIKATQKFLVPSSFVAKSLEFSGVKSDQLIRCPYGVDLSQFSMKKYEEIQVVRTRPIRFVYVGGVKELKGVAYLFDAFMEIPAEVATLTVVGKYNSTDKDTSPYMDRISFTGNILHSDVANELKKADVFVFASLGEGLSLSTLEAAACGLPLIVTENSGVNDDMSEQEGFVIPIQSKDAIKQKVLWFTEHPEMIRYMGEAARRFALKFSWEAYYERIGQIFTQL